MRHDPGVVHDHVDPVVFVDGPLNESLDIAALGHIGLEPEGTAAFGGNGLDDPVDPVLPPRSEHNFRAVLCEKARRAFPDAAACARNYDYFPLDLHRDVPPLRQAAAQVSQIGSSSNCDEH